MKDTADRPELVKRLREVPIPRSYAWQIAHGRRTPSLALAKRIEEATGIPPSTWPLTQTGGKQA